MNGSAIDDGVNLPANGELLPTNVEQLDDFCQVFYPTKGQAATKNRPSHEITRTKSDAKNCDGLKPAAANASPDQIRASTGFKICSIGQHNGLFNAAGVTAVGTTPAPTPTANPNQRTCHQFHMLMR
jgi:hypothetical protein